MAIFAGKDVTVSIDISATPTLIGHCKVTSFSVSNTAVDATTKTEHPTRTLNPDASITAMSISVSGIASDNTGFAELKAQAVAAPPSDTFTFTFGDGETAVGVFVITSFDWSGGTEDNAEFSASFESAGTVTIS